MRVRIDIGLFVNTEAYVDKYSDSFPEESNVSDTSSILFKGSSGYKGFQLSANKDNVVSPLDGTYKLFSSKGYPGFLSRDISDSNRTFTEASESKIFISNKAEYLFIVFDPTTNEYATDLELLNWNNGYVIRIQNNKSVVLKIPLEELNITNGTNLGIFIHEWSNTNSSAKITYISTSFSYTYTGKDINEFVCSENVLDAQLNIQPGIVEQFADVRIYDRENLLHAIALQGGLTKNCNVKIYAIDDTNGDKTYTLGSYDVSEWSIHNNDRKVGIYCNDKSSIFNDINIGAIAIKDRSVDDMLKLLFSYVKNVSWRYIDSETKTYCKGIVTPDSWFFPGTLRDLLNKICILGMIRIYWHINAFVIARCW